MFSAQFKSQKLVLVFCLKMVCLLVLSLSRDGWKRDETMATSLLMNVIIMTRGLLVEFARCVFANLNSESVSRPSFLSSVRSCELESESLGCSWIRCIILLSNCLLSETLNILANPSYLKSNTKTWLWLKSNQKLHQLHCISFLARINHPLKV